MFSNGQRSQISIRHLNKEFFVRSLYRRINFTISRVLRCGQIVVKSCFDHDFPRNLSELFSGWMKQIKTDRTPKTQCLSHFWAKDNSSRYRNIESCYGALEGTRTPDLLVRSVSKTIPHGRLTAFCSVWRSFVGVFRRSFPFILLCPFSFYFWSGQNCGQT